MKRFYLYSISLIILMAAGCELHEGWGDATCNNHTCELMHCLDGYSLVAKTCVPSATCCGTSCEDCTVIGAICSSSNSKNGECVDKCTDGKVNCEGVCIDPTTSHNRVV